MHVGTASREEAPSETVLTSKETLFSTTQLMYSWGPVEMGPEGLGAGWQRGRGSVVLPEFSLTSLVSLLNFRFWMVLLAWRVFSNFIICF